MDVHAFLEEYASKSDEELLRLALHAEELTPEANAALKAELTKRRLDSAEQLNAFRLDEQEQKKKEERNPKLFSWRGSGRDRFGKADCVSDPMTGMERFKTTVFVTFFLVPVDTNRNLSRREKSQVQQDHISGEGAPRLGAGVKGLGGRLCDPARHHLVFSASSTHASSLGR